MIMLTKNKFGYTTLTVFLGCLIWSVYGLADECISANNRRGVCRTFSNCQTNSSWTGHQPVICRVKNDVAYICCELPESESTESEEDALGSNERPRYSLGDDSDSSSDNDDEPDDKYYSSRRNQKRRNRGRGKATDDYYKSRGIGENADAQIYYPSHKRPVWPQSGETSNAYHFSSDKDTFYNDYQGRRPQTSPQYNEWYPPNQQSPQFASGGNSNSGWQKNEYYDNRRTTERPRTTTSRIIHPADFRPNPSHSFNRPQSSTYVNGGSQNFNSGGNRPNSFNSGGNRPDSFSSAGSRPDNSNSGGSRPEHFNSGVIRPDNFNSGGNRPNNFNSGGIRPNNIYSGGSRPQNFNSGVIRPDNFNSGGNRPDIFNSGGNRPQNFNSAMSRPDNFNSGGGSSQYLNSGGGRPHNEISKPKRISELKCEEYAEAVTLKVSGLPLTPDPKPVTISVGKCISAQQLIVGGENTTVGEFPHMAAIGFRDRNRPEISWKCGGSLISEQFILTAAHCTTSERKPVKVRLGDYNLKNNNDGAYPEDYSIQEIINHPEYKKPSKYNDIALLKLSRRVEVRRHIRPACLHIHRDIPDPKVIAIGWGRVERDQDVSDTLLKVALSIIDKNTCNQAYSHFRRQNVLPQGIIDTQLCAGELAGGKDTCQGDSGGPIEIISKTNKCLHYIVGVTSFGKQCALENSPGVYTRVSAYIPWIESIVWPQ